MKTTLTLCLSLFVLISCQTNSLQTYMVDHKDDENFISLDFSLKTFVDNFDDFSEEQKNLFKDVRKVNILAFKKDNSNDKDYSEKRNLLTQILSEEFSKQQLMSVNDKGRQMKMFADNMDDKVKEIVIYANDNDKGFLLLRLLGDDLNPSNFYEMMKMSDEMNFEDLAQMIDL
ncbi:DUF4252 domain-containing protein [Mesohalobacter halotolerans]|uniref:DUF4252 domain-containing protein n=1 Tax=Mesohalobacter halotolerans TaxID=1883405 RepID=A0A4U5TQQ0_9FLAO|nr:DUF4252 domain-containing protein [Mesohalobacter halotolerans]MBS3738951.1 DUF4252 domain-containing protein [Psychroflexus sp.]TKS56376.1 DUF4252 domain-containing protein [Mesohalobacter halotolerans]